ncbi:TIGR00341 family protein [Flammeovirga aprica]|uniref:TIGR00341 family protein n=1 Tax=Flammeovirga aprica JL-4 TaxID=694437 RepID=A0A7X9XA18_9BACT|nr:TIGR00341 family protein [Flammeovirga aprica]NME69236.1 TIGR00341 family protein [Flammeovirga aprica JL-4]
MSEQNTKSLIYVLRKLAIDTLSIREGSDPEATIEGITKDISFKGHAAWILIFSILIASIGLNANSTATVIGAMLISPLMGPILGIGTAIGIHDVDMMRRALKNLAIAVFISLATSTLYFALTPLNLEQSELLARTKPTILDVFVAFFGGFSGIIAGSRKEKSNVIPGVAIATALMPPLCTAGYGLATGMYSYFFGAFYLFFINSVFITLSTYIVVKFLRFPVKTFIDRARYRKYRSILFAFLIIVVSPSAVIFFKVIQETRFKISADAFIKDNTTFNESELLTSKVSYTDSLSVIDLYYMGKKIDEGQIVFLNEMIPRYGLSATKDEMFPVTIKTEVRIHQEDGQDFDIDEKFAQYSNTLHVNLLKDIYTKNDELIKDKDLKIKLLEKRIFNLTKEQEDTLHLDQISKELHFQFPQVKRFAINDITIQSWVGDSLVSEKSPVLLLELDEKTKKKEKQSQELTQRTQEWIRIRLNNEEIKALVL